MSPFNFIKRFSRGGTKSAAKVECYFLAHNKALKEKGYATPFYDEKFPGVCPSCGNKDPVYYDILDLHHVPDGMPDVLMEGPVVSRRVLQALQKAGIKGLQPRRAKIHEAAEDGLKVIERPWEDKRIPLYYGLGYGNLNLVLLKEGLKPLVKPGGNYCVDCAGHYDVLRFPPRVAVDWSTWNGSDYFFVSQLNSRLAPFFTQRFIEVLLKFGVDEYYDIIRLDETSDRDFFDYEFGPSSEEEEKRHRPGDPWPPAGVSSR